MDVNGDGQLTEEEFVKGCLQDDELSKILTFWNFYFVIYLNRYGLIKD